MGIFKEVIYSILTGSNKKCLSLSEYPAVQAEMEEKTNAEICETCIKCWRQLQQKQR